MLKVVNDDNERISLQERKSKGICELFTRFSDKTNVFFFGFINHQLI